MYTKNASVHGVFMSLFDVGTLIIGKSGVGKSDLALSLLDRGHAFIADDMITFSPVHESCLVGRAPPLLRNFLSVRGVGVLDVPGLFGAQAVLEQKELSFVITLEKPVDLSQDISFHLTPWSLLGVTVPSFTLPLSEGRPRALLLEACVRQYQQVQKGYDANACFLENHHTHLSIAE